MTTTTNQPAVADGADNVLANAGQAVIHTSETLLGDIVALFSGTTYGHVFLAQIAAIAFAVFVGLVVHKVAGAASRHLRFTSVAKTGRPRLFLCASIRSTIFCFR